MRTENNTEFDAAYWASKSPAVRKLKDLEADQGDSQVNNTIAFRRRYAAELIAQGETIDVTIEVWGWDPFKVMHLREDFGYAWVPSGFQAPGAPVAPFTDIAQIPPNGIKVSLDLADYPPFQAVS